MWAGEREPNEKSGFTIIEVMLFLAVAGLLMVGVLGGTYSSIATQRYNDSVRGFAEFLRQIYSEVLSPESLGTGNSDQYAIYGKIAVFGLNDQNAIYTATLVGDPNIPSGSGDFMWELNAVNAKLFCGSEDDSGAYESTVNKYSPLWQAEILDPNHNLLKGTVIIARSPTSGTVHTVFAEKTTFDLTAPDGCQPGIGNQVASQNLRKAIADNATNPVFRMSDVNFCVRSEDSKMLRDVVLATDGHNTSAINILTGSESGSVCH